MASTRFPVLPEASIKLLYLNRFSRRLYHEQPVPQDAVVTMYLITGRCTVRVLKRSDGQKFAPVLDSEDDLYVEN